VGINSSTPSSLTWTAITTTRARALGVQYRPAVESPWTFSAGVAYDSSAVDDDKRTVSVPMGMSGVSRLGAQYAVTPNLTLGAAYEFAWLGDMPVNQVRGAGPLQTRCRRIRQLELQLLCAQPAMDLLRRRRREESAGRPGKY